MGVIIIIGKQISCDVKSEMHFYQMKYVFLTIHLRAKSEPSLVCTPVNPIYTRKINMHRSVPN